jgi:hypothetical protein
VQQAGSNLATLFRSSVKPVQRPTSVFSSHTLSASPLSTSVFYNIPVQTYFPGPLRLLALDGGGYRGLALLYVLRHIMRNIPGIDPSEKLYPYKYFDLIGGTSTGGLVAIMLGRLGMDIQAAIEKYQELGPTIFGRDQGTFLGVVVQGARFDSQPFDYALAEWVGNQPMLDPDIEQHCRVSRYHMSYFTCLFALTPTYTTSVFCHYCSGAACHCDYPHYYSVISRPSTMPGIFPSVAHPRSCSCYLCCPDIFPPSQSGRWLFLQRCRSFWLQQSNFSCVERGRADPRIRRTAHWMCCELRHRSGKFSSTRGAVQFEPKN